MRRLHWGEFSVAVTIVLGAFALLGWINKPVGGVLLLVGMGMLFHSFTRVERQSTGPAPPSEPEVFVRYDADLAADPNAPLLVRNEGPGMAHEIQIGNIEFLGSALRFDVIQTLDAGEERPAVVYILGGDGYISRQHTTLLSFLDQTRRPRDFGRIYNVVVGIGKVPPDQLFDDIVLPFHVTYRRIGGKQQVRRHQLIFNPGSRR